MDLVHIEDAQRMSIMTMEVGNARKFVRRSPTQAHFFASNFTSIPASWASNVLFSPILCAVRISSHMAAAGDGGCDAVVKEELSENAEHVLFVAKECYVYLIPPRKSAASYRADEWNINKWNWEGVLRVVSKGDECTIRLEDKASGELYAQAPVRGDQPLPIEVVIDSSRFFVLRIEDTSGPHGRHAFIGIGFRERIPAYDFQAALYDHIKYLNKKKHAEEMDQEYQLKPSVDYSLKDGETFHLSLKTSKVYGPGSRSTFFNPGVQPPSNKAGSKEQGLPIPILAPPPVSLLRVPSKGSEERPCSENQDNADDDFGDFQRAG